jgi:hypothetical protein
MGQTTVSANLDGEVLMISYRYLLQQGDSIMPVPLSVVVTYENTSTLGTTNVVSVATIAVDPASILADQKAQTIQIRLLNPRYRNNLYVSVSENRNNTPTVTKVAVLFAADSVVTPNNPIRDEIELLPQPSDEFLGTYRPFVQLENNPGLPANNNITLPEVSLLGNVYELADGLDYVQGEPKIGLVDGKLSLLDGIWVENSSYNLLPDPSFSEPLVWELFAPGQSVSLTLLANESYTVNQLTMSIASPNPFSAMDVSLLKWPNHISIPTGQPYLAFSVFAKLSSSIVQTFQVTLEFFDAICSSLSTVTDNSTLSPSKLFSELAYAFDVPALATSLTIKFGMVLITEKLSVVMMWPQLEPSAVATSRVYPTDGIRELDILRTTSQFEIAAPLYVSLNILFRESQYILGLLDTTTALLSGIQWAVSGNRMSFRVYDGAGNVSYTTSDAFSAAEGDNTKLAFWLTATSVEFFVNDVIISSHALVYALPAVTKTVLVGNLHQANQTTQSKITGLRVSKIKPS